MSYRHRRSWRLVLTALLAAPALLAAQAQAAESDLPSAETAAAETNSVLDQRLLYQLLIGEMALNAGDTGTAYEWILDAARRTGDDGLFRRAVEIALQSRAGEQALVAARAWQLAAPESAEALRQQLQILLLLNRTDGLAEPLKALLALTPMMERPGLVTALPRFLQRANEPRKVAELLEDVLKPYREAPALRTPVLVALGRAWLEARDPDRALGLASEARAQEPGAPGPALLAMELMRERPQAERIVVDYLAQPQAELALRLAYVRLLTNGQRYADAVVELERVTARQPELSGPYLTLGALQLELKRPKESEQALLRYVDLVKRELGGASPSSQAGQEAAEQAASPPTVAVTGSPTGATDSDDEDSEAKPGEGLVQAWLMLSQAAEQRGDFAAAENWLKRIDDPQRALEVQTRRASILARQGRLTQARELIHQVPERSADDQRAKLVAEAGLLRDVKHWRDAFNLLSTASQKFVDDADLLYEQAMMAEKIDRIDDMERLLRRVIALKPDNAHAHNALGYSLADRRQRLPEARQLIQRALELAPGDPFITDSLGWVEFRLGNREEAIRLLRSAYTARPDPEIAAHLGEALWAVGQRDEARSVWREGNGRDSANDVLRETLARLRVDL